MAGSVADDLEALRASWGETGIPRDAASQILAVVCRHMDKPKLAWREPTPNEGDWCELCGWPRSGHGVMVECVGQFAKQPPREREAGEEG